MRPLVGGKKFVFCNVINMGEDCFLGEYIFFVIMANQRQYLIDLDIS